MCHIIQLTYRIQTLRLHGIRTTFRIFNANIFSHVLHLVLTSVIRYVYIICLTEGRKHAWERVIQPFLSFWSVNVCFSVSGGRCSLSSWLCFIVWTVPSPECDTSLSWTDELLHLAFSWMDRSRGNRLFGPYWGIIVYSLSWEVSRGNFNFVQFLPFTVTVEPHSGVRYDIAVLSHEIKD